MSALEIKGLLKSAREAVKSKDYAKTIEICKVSDKLIGKLVVCTNIFVFVGYTEAGQRSLHGIGNDGSCLSGD